MDFTIFGYYVSAWQFFAAFGLVFSLLEVFAPGFVLLPIGVASFLTVPIAYFFDDWLTQLGAMGLNLFIVFWLTNRFIRPNLKSDNFKTGVDSLIGNTAEVTELIKSNGTGYVKLYGDRWQAYSKGNDEFSIGERVKIVDVDGNKVVVSKIN
ncbi:MAG: NfeD family protein [Bdellovibrionales bacterium]|nr:NfeD family protein [Bdellovibrionales bacterium]